MILDGQNGYVTAEGEGTVIRFIKTGDNAGGVIVAKDLKLPCGLAQDEMAIYFTERFGGKIWRMVK